MDDEAQAETEAETDTEAPSDRDGCRRHRIIRSRAGSQQQQLTPGEREAKQKADRARPAFAAVRRMSEGEQDPGFLL